MVLIINQRTGGHAGAIARADCWESAGGKTQTYTVVTPTEVERRTAGKQVVIAIHGFNVSRPDAVRAYISLERQLALTADQVFFGVAWPGDGWIPVVNYPWESGDAASCGRYLATWLTAAMPQAASFNFVSHSLGGRVLLEAVRTLERSAAQVCITAGAVDDDVLSASYAEVKGKAERISVLTSTKDVVLRAAYPLGDFVTDVFLGDRDSPWHGALGRKGPNPAEVPPGVTTCRIPTDPAYGHGDYFPPGNGGVGNGRWKKSVDYMSRALKGDEPTRWE